MDINYIFKHRHEYPLVKSWVGITSNQYGVLTIYFVFKYSNISPLSINWRGYLYFGGIIIISKLKKKKFYRGYNKKYSIAVL